MNNYSTGDILEASGDPDFLESAEMPRKAGQWAEIQRARSEYLKEWEEDMRYAQELANEGM